MTATRNGTGPDHATTWTPVDLGPVIAGDVAIERPAHFRRSDGVGLVYPNQQHEIHAEPESCKTWWAAAGSAYEIRSGLHVVVIDFESYAPTWVERLRALGVADPDLLGRFHYVNPEEPISEQGWRVDPYLERAAVVVIDGVNEGMARHGLDLNSNADAAKWQQIPRRCQRYGAAVIQIDHVTKSRENRGRYAIGAQAKLAASDVAYSMRVIKPFSRGRDGLVAIKVEKDRAGYVRSHEDGDGRVALMRLTSKPDGSVRVVLEAPEDAPHEVFRPTGLMEKASREIEFEPGLSRNEIATLIGGKRQYALAAVGLLVAEGFVRIEPDGQAQRHHSSRPYREGEDPQRFPGSEAVPDRFPEPVEGTGSPVPLPVGEPGTGTGPGDVPAGSPVPLVALYDDDEGGLG